LLKSAGPSLSTVMVLPWQGIVNKRQISANVLFFISRSPQKYSLFILLQENGNFKKNMKKYEKIFRLTPP
jgi:hypothetical protein